MKYIKVLENSTWLSEEYLGRYGWTGQEMTTSSGLDNGTHSGGWDN